MTVWTPTDNGYADLTSHDTFTQGLHTTHLPACAATIRCTGRNMPKVNPSGP